MRENGFTVIELLVAMLLGGLLLAGLSAYVASLSHELRETPEHRQLEAISAFGPKLSALLERAIPSDAADAFVETAQSIELTVPPPQSLGEPGPLRLRLSASSTSSGVALDVTVQPTNNGTVPPALQRPLRLIDGLSAVRFESTGDAATRASHLPRLIRILLTSRQQDVWTIAAEPRLTSPAGCRFDPISMTCRP